jgi:hypothetical protein
VPEDEARVSELDHRFGVHSSLLRYSHYSTVHATSNARRILVFIFPFTLYHIEIYVLDLVGQLMEPKLGTVRWILANLDVLMPDCLGTTVEKDYVDLVMSVSQNCNSGNLHQQTIYRCPSGTFDPGSSL